jgi:hypothetical protein
MSALAETPKVLRVRGANQEPPRCHYCGNTSWDLVTEVLGERTWRRNRLRHEVTVHDPHCPVMPLGYAACYRCDLALAPGEQQPVILRMDVRLGHMREDVQRTVKEADDEQFIKRVQRAANAWHTHPWDGAFDWGDDDRGHHWLGKEGYPGPAVPGCPQCFRRVVTAGAERQESEWANVVLDLEDGTTGAYVDQYPAEVAIRCGPRVGCHSDIHDEHARGEPTAAELNELADEAEKAEAAPRADRTAALREERLALLPDDAWVDKQQVADLWGVTLRTVKRELPAYVEAGEVAVRKRRQGRGGYPADEYQRAEDANRDTVQG